MQLSISTSPALPKNKNKNPIFSQNIVSYALRLLYTSNVALRKQTRREQDERHFKILHRKSKYCE